MACIEGDGNGTCSNFSRRCLRGPHNLKFKLKFCFYLRQRLTCPNLEGGGGEGVTPLLIICKLVLRVNPHCFGRRQPDDSSSSGLRERVVFLAPSVLWSLPQWPLRCIAEQKFLPANASFPFRWYIQGDSDDKILLVAAKWVAKASTFTISACIN